MPFRDASVDVVISNCVVNLSADKPAVLREVARVRSAAIGSRPDEVERRVSGHVRGVSGACQAGRRW